MIGKQQILFLVTEQVIDGPTKGNYFEQILMIMMNTVGKTNDFMT